MHHIPGLSLLLAGLFLLASCGETTEAPAPSLELSVSEADLTVGQRFVFTATLTGAAASTLSWSATCGVVVGDGASVAYEAPDQAATCKITARSEARADLVASATITVRAAAEVSVDMEPESAVLTAGSSRSFTAVVSGADDPTVVWSATCGDVSGSGGTVTYSAPDVVPASGTCSLTATSAADPDRSATATIAIEPAPFDGFEVTVEPPSAALAVDQQLTFTATVTGGSDTSVTWSASCGSVSQTDADTGRYTAPPKPSDGACTLTATSVADPDASASASVRVTLGSGAVLAAGRNHSLALASDGRVWSWGRNSEGQLGDGSTIDRAAPVQVSGLSNVRSVAAGWDYSLALTSNGAVWAWGENALGQLGDRTQTDRTGPVRVTGLDDVVAIAAGQAHSFALRRDGTIWGWGWNYDGQLGLTGPPFSLSSPVQVPDLPLLRSIDAGFAHSVAVARDGSVWAWGRNFNGELGDGTLDSRTEPMKVTGDLEATSVSAGLVHSLALLVDGSVVAWGANGVGQLCMDGDQTEPTSIPGAQDILRITVGAGQSFGLDAAGVVHVCGLNGDGQLGDGTVTDRPTLHAAPDFYGPALFVASGTLHSLFLYEDGRVGAAGSNEHGQLGNGVIGGGALQPLLVELPRIGWP